MKSTQQKARDLFLQADLSKTEIAERLNVSRRTIYQWSVDGDWEKLRISARHMPAILAEKCYYLIGHIMDNILSREAFYSTISKEEVNMIYKLTTTVSKLKQGSTVNENMETFTYLLERVKKDDPQLADQLMPHINGYIEARKGQSESTFMLHGFNEEGVLLFPDKQIKEQWEDEKEAEAIKHEAAFNLSAAPTPAPLQSLTPTPTPTLTPAPPQSSALAPRPAPPQSSAPTLTPTLTPAPNPVAVGALMSEHLDRIFGKSLTHPNTKYPDTKYPPTQRNTNTGSYKSPKVAHAA